MQKEVSWENSTSKIQKKDQYISRCFFNGGKGKLGRSIQNVFLDLSKNKWKPLALYSKKTKNIVPHALKTHSMEV